MRLIFFLAILFVTPAFADPGFTGGVLTIPYKFHPSDHSMSGGGTAGGYVGWHTTWAGLTVTPIVSAGLALADSKYGTGFSMSSGLIGSIGATKVHMGMIFGTDWFAKSTSYPYDGKLWIALEIGYNFGD